ncbi:MAG TPA: haloacid dehalogenase-like hydrolase [Solirubrobacteraceae bacterium]|nr:haloacid dehalogenase-like hydrolase [Solirubrobacteraceae bacterium]
MLLLFDIDGTLLLKAAAEHRDALYEAVREVWGVSDPAAVPVEAAGRTDTEIARHICLLSGVPSDAVDARMDEFRTACVAAYARRVPDDISERVAPGVEALLEELAAREGTILSLVTGNLEPVARLKLERAGIGRHFARGQGAFGSDSEERAALPAIARRRAGEPGRPYPRERTVIIGDTPRDIACARADGVHTLALATGPYAADELAGADAVLASAAELPSALAALV